MMKKLILTLICATAMMAGMAQKQITLEDIWRDYRFYPQGIQAISSMNDGEHYCILTRTGIENYAYQTREKVRTV